MAFAPQTPTEPPRHVATLPVPTCACKHFTKSKWNAAFAFIYHESSLKVLVPSNISGEKRQRSSEYQSHTLHLRVFHLAAAHPAAGITHSCKALGFFFQLCNEWFREQLLIISSHLYDRDTASTVKLILHEANHRKFDRGKNAAGADYPEVLVLETSLAHFALLHFLFLVTLHRI